MTIRLLKILFWCLSALQLNAQPTLPMTGEYYLQGVREVASGFRFNADGTFDFFFIYGAVDRMGRGTWTRQGDSIFLDSPRKPERDFVLKETKKMEGNQVVVQISDPNEMARRFVHCWLKTPEGVLEGDSDAEGIIAFDAKVATSISLVHEFFPERFSVFEVESPADNFFVFTIDPRIVEVEFNHFVLRLENDKTLTGGHPLLEGTAFDYDKVE